MYSTVFIDITSHLLTYLLHIIIQCVCNMTLIYLPDGRSSCNNNEINHVVIVIKI